MAAIADPVSTDTNCVIRFLPIKCSTERLQHLAYFAPWNTDSTKIVLFSRSAIPQGRGILYPIFSSSRQACPEPFLCQDKLRRRDAKSAKKKFFLFLRTWRPLPRGVRPWRSCSDCGEINTPQGESPFIRSSPWRPLRPLRLCESNLFPDS